MSPVVYRWTFPYPTGVNVNHLYEGFGKHRRKTDAADAWEQHARLIVRMAHCQPVPPYGLRLTVYPPDDKVERDLDGVLKLTQDAIFRELGQQDTMTNLPLIRLVAFPPDRAPRLVVALWTLDADFIERERRFADDGYT